MPRWFALFSELLFLANCASDRDSPAPLCSLQDHGLRNPSAEICEVEELGSYKKANEEHN